MSGSSLLSQMISNFFNNVQHDPIFLLSFIVPILFLLFSTVILRTFIRRTKIDGPPSLEQKRERFVIPRDFFSKETEKIRADDYEHFLRPLSNEFHALKDFQEYYKYLEKQYRRYVAMSRSSRKKRRKAGIEGRKKTFDDILNLYNRLRNTKFDIVEFEHEEERIL